MKTTRLILCFTIILTIAFSNTVFAITPSQRAATNIWLQQQYDSNPIPVEIMSTLKNNTADYKIKIYSYKFDAKTISVSAKTPLKSDIIRYKRILDTTFMFDKIIISQQKKANNTFYFKLKLNKANIEKRGIYQKSKQAIFKSKTQIKYTINKLIRQFQSFTKLKKFCPAPALNIKPTHVGARVKLLIYSYHLKLSSSYRNAKKVLTRIANNSHYLSMHNISITANKKDFDLELDLRFYQLANRRNNLDKAYAFKKVTSDKVCD